MEIWSITKSDVFTKTSTKGENAALQNYKAENEALRFN